MLIYDSQHSFQTIQAAVSAANYGALNNPQSQQSVIQHSPKKLITINCRRTIPHSDAQSTSEPKRFLYLRISGASLSAITGTGATLTLIRELRRTRVESDWESSAGKRAEEREDWPVEKPNIRNERIELRIGCDDDETESALLTAWQYLTKTMYIA